MKKTVLITGASGAIGGACARAFAGQGFNVVLGFSGNPKTAQSLESEINLSGGCAVCICADIRSAEQVDAMFGKAESRFGAVDVLVNNAGVALQKLLQLCTDEDYERIFDVNVKGSFNCCRRALPRMIAAGSGTIVNISSVWGVHGASCEVLYSASKAAIIGLTRALAKETGPSGIRVNCIAPGVIHSRMNSALDEECMEELKNETPLGRIGSPEEVAAAAVFLAGDAAGFITGQVLGVDGGFPC